MERDGDFLEKLTDLLDFMIPGYKKEGKSQLVIAIGTRVDNIDL